MHTVYAAADPLEAEILRGYLAEHGIAAEVFGAGLWGARGELPADAWPRLVIADGAQVEAARELLRRYEHRRHAAATWVCVCGERAPVHFEICWACGAERPAH
ncbi:putative signal transducing protein [Solimonas flava]|uniref:putative signal transducing protein n=1 Tax=Solimonas flava TaxID=415849 RepID=UPI0004255200|nr:DUF2007 domain-containing protein [Solimonas flava]